MMEKPVLVIGLGPSGLFLIRQLYNITTNIYAIGQRNEIGKYSKYIHREKCYLVESEEKIEEVLKEIYNREAMKTQVYICSDMYLTIFLHNYEKWKVYFDSDMLDLHILQIINDKQMLATYFGEQSNIIPPVFSLKKFKKEIKRKYPIIIKIKEKNFNLRNSPILKTYICSCDAEFINIYYKLEEDQLLDAYIIQPYILGNNGNQYSVGGYYLSGKEKASVVVRQIKQYPQGVSAEVYSVDNEISRRISKLTYDFVNKINYSGFLEMEYKYDIVSGNIFLLDINPRPWGWISILECVYDKFYLALEGEQLKKKNKKVVWKNIMRLFLAARNRNNIAEDLEIKEYVKKIDLVELKDLKPLIMIPMILIKKFLKRIY